MKNKTLYASDDHILEHGDDCARLSCSGSLVYTYEQFDCTECDTSILTALEVGPNEHFVSATVSK